MQAHLPASVNRSPGAASKAGGRPAPDKGTTESEAIEGSSERFDTVSAGRLQEAPNPMIRLRFPFKEGAQSGRFCWRPAPVFAKIGFAVCFVYGTIWEKVGRLPCGARLDGEDEKPALQNARRHARRHPHLHCVTPRGHPRRALA